MSESDDVTEDAFSECLEEKESAGMENASQEGFCKEEADREVSEMEESLDVEQENENETSVEAPTGTITGQENDTPPAGRGAYVVSEPTITDDDLSDTKDESLLEGSPANVNIIKKKTDFFFSAQPSHSNYEEPDTLTIIFLSE